MSIIPPDDESDRALPEAGTRDHELANEPPIIVQPVGTKPQSLESLANMIEGVFSGKAYGAPRVFDLFTLMAITFAFASLFAFLRLLKPIFETQLAETTVSIGAFIALVGVAQAVLFHGEKPRLASVVAGPVAWFWISVSLYAWMGTDANLLITIPSIEVLMALFLFSVLGVPFGYLAGAIVAGVFMIADLFRRRMITPSPQNETVNSHPWN